MGTGYGWVIAASLMLSGTMFAQTDGDGFKPVGADGKQLNLDLEAGDLTDWTASGEAFTGQPIKGDSPTARGRGQASQHAGEYWIGGYEKHLSDAPTGTLTSRPFKVTHPYASFLVGGGEHESSRVELVDAATGSVIFKSSGRNEETLYRVHVDLRAQKDKSIYIRLIDESRGAWGHVNFDDFRFHATPPARDRNYFVSEPLSAAEAANQMRVPEGFEVTVAAAEPDVKQPIAMAFDHRGRLWIAEAYCYPFRRADKDANDRILIFEDADGDGSFDKRTVFAEGLNLVSGIELGHGGVFVGAAPYLLFIADRNGDDKPDGEPKVLLDGWGYEDTHETLNSFIWGPDGWLYGCHGVFTSARVGKPGTPEDKRLRFNAAVWRYHPVRDEFEVFAYGGSNQWGVDFDEHGQAFMTTCRSANGGGPVTHVIQGAYYWRQAGAHHNPNVYQVLLASTDTGHGAGGAGGDTATYGGHAHCGAMIYLGDNWPEQWRNRLLTNNIHGHRLNVEDLTTRRGSGYRVDHLPNFLYSHDKRFMAVNLRYGPDGGVYMIDWYDQQNCHTPREVWDRSNGRIYKLTHGKPKPAKVDIAAASDEQLVEYHLHRNDWFVRHARRAMQERMATGKLSPAAVARLGKIIDDDPDITRKLRAMWTLGAIGAFDDALATKLLEHANEYVRAWAIQLTLEDRATTPGVARQLARMAIEEPAPLVRLYLASAMQRLPAEFAMPIGKALAQRAEDANDRNLPGMVWYGVEPIAAINPQQSVELAIASAMPNVRKNVARRLTVAHYADGAKDEPLNAVIQAAILSSNQAVTRELLEGVAAGLAGRREAAMPSAWPQAYRLLKGTDDQAVRDQVDRLALVFGDETVLNKLRATVADGKAPVDQRRAALQSLLDRRDAKLPPILHGLLDDATLRREAIRGLAAYDHPDTPKLLLARYGKLDAEAKRDALATLAARPGYAASLLDAIDTGGVNRADVPVYIARQIHDLNDSALRERLAKSWGVVQQTGDDQRKQIERYTKLLTPKALADADLVAGRTLYDQACGTCHTLHGAGGRIGPDLTGSDRTNLQYLLENIIDPNAVVGLDYQLTVITTADDRAVAGVVTGQTDAALTVQTATEQVTVPLNEVKSKIVTPASLMPTGLLSTLGDPQVRDLFAYLMSQQQVVRFGEPVTLFDGKTFAGWEGDRKWFRIEDGAIVGGNFNGPIPKNQFLCTEKQYGDFELRLKVKLLGEGVNSGVQFRTKRIPNHHEVSGYQADAGKGWWGKLYDESRRNRVLAEPDAKQVGEFVRYDDWNDYRIRAVGPRIELWVNGVKTIDYIEKEPNIDRAGVIAVQIHSGPPSEAWFKDITIAVPVEGGGGK